MARFPVMWPVDRSARRRAALVLALLVLAAYLPVLRNGFVNYDDQIYLTENRQIHAGLTWENVRWAFTTRERGHLWHPLTWISHQLDISLFGLDPRGHHAMSLLFHGANTLLVFSLFAGLTGSLLPSAFVAAVFGVHPLHVESVAWAAERKDVLSTFFGLLALRCHLAWMRRPLPSRRAASAFLFALSLLAKPMLVSLPLVLLILDWWPLGRLLPTAGDDRRARWHRAAALLVEKLPFVALSAGAVAAAFAIPEKATPLLEYPFLLRLKNALLACCTYVGQTLWPEGLAVLYPHPLQLGWATPLAAAGFLAAATILSLRLARRRPALAAGWLWFLVVLLPAIGIVPISHHAMADRYTYLSMIGLTLAPAFAFPGKPGAARVRAATAGAASVMLIAAVALTRTQVGLWRDSATLFRHALAVTPDNSIARLNLAAALAESGQGPEAVEHCRAAVRLDPGDHEVLTTCGSILADEGAEEEAFDHYRRALAIWPDSPAALNNLGALLSAQNRHLEAVSLLERAIALQPDLGKAYNNLGTALLQLGRQQEALERFRESVRLAPRNPKAHYNLGNLLAGIGREGEAAAEYRLAVEIDPGFADAWNNLGGLALRRGDLSLARDYVRRAVDLQPGNRSFRKNLEAVQAGARVR